MSVVPYQVGHCVCCGGQSLVKDRYGRPVNGMPGSKMCYICLHDGSGKVFSRIGYVTLCGDCNADELNLDDVIEGLHQGNSGVPRDTFELSMAKSKSLEVVTEFERG